MSRPSRPSPLDLPDFEDFEPDAPRSKGKSTLDPATILADLWVKDSAVTPATPLRLVMITPAPEWHRVLASAIGRRHPLPSPRFNFWCQEDDTKPGEGDKRLTKYMENKESFLCLFYSEHALPGSLRAAVGIGAIPRLELPPLTPQLVSQMVKKLCGRTPRRSLTEAEVRRLRPVDLGLAWTPGLSGEDFVHRLARIIDASSRVQTGPGFDGLIGMDQAVAWGREVARDLEALRHGQLSWNDCARGALLYGPPGTGKTSFARALARECGLPLVDGSYSKWQAAGHLGDFLKALRGTFAEARQKAPCILFIDELDGFGRRDSVSGDNADYQRQTVNGLLEELDGIGGREGVVVLGATNHRDHIDPAVVRSGRIERPIAIAMPDQEALGRIFALHLGDALSKTELRHAALESIGASGADVERWCRGARSRARSAHRAVVMADVLAEICGTDERSADELRRTAIHEAGHALLAELQWPGSVAGMTIRAGGGRGGFVTLNRDEEPALLTRDHLTERVRLLLAGRAAEELLLGEPSAGAGGSEGSDLARAALTVVNGLTALGLGGDITLWTGPVSAERLSDTLARHPRLARDAEAAVAEAYGEATTLLREHKAILERLADSLLAARSLLAADLRQLLAAMPPSSTSCPAAAA